MTTLTTVVRIQDVKPLGHRHHLGDLGELSASLAMEGIRHPIIVTTNNVLVSGERRLEAARLLGWEYVLAVAVTDIDSAAECMKREIADLTASIPLLPSEMASMALTLEKLDRPLASQYTPGVPRQDRYDVRKVVSAALGVSTAALSRAKRILLAAQAGDPSAKEALQEMDRTGQISGVHDRWRTKVEKGKHVVHHRDPYGLGKQTGKNQYRGTTTTDAIIRTLSTLEGISQGYADLSSEQLIMVPDDVRKEWARKLTEVISSLRLARDIMKEQA